MTVIKFAYKNIVHQNIEKELVFFYKSELSLILNLYSRQVSKGVWRDYALDSECNIAIFSIYKHSHDNPMYKILKTSKKGFRSNPIYFIKRDNKLLDTSNDIKIILTRFEKKLGIKKYR